MPHVVVALIYLSEMYMTPNDNTVVMYYRLLFNLISCQSKQLFIKYLHIVLQIHYLRAEVAQSGHKTLNQCWFTVGPPSTTLDQRNQH